MRCQLHGEWGAGFWVLHRSGFRVYHSVCLLQDAFATCKFDGPKLEMREGSSSPLVATSGRRVRALRP